MKQQLYARKIRQLKGLSKKLQRQRRVPDVFHSRKDQRLILKLKSLVRELQAIFSVLYLKRILGSAALVAGLLLVKPASAQSFLKPVANPFGLQAADTLAFPAFADLDGDGDMDLMVAETFGVLEYFENTGTASHPQFAAPLKNPFGLDTLLRDSTVTYVFPTFADLDGDGDPDLILGMYDGSFEYFQNTGTATRPEFSAPVKNPFGLVSVYELAVPAFADLDGDGDLDLLAGEYYGDMIYFENKGGARQPRFSAPVSNPFKLDSVNQFAFPAFADLDNDGDQDLLVGEYYGAMEYFQNTGTKTLPKFAPKMTNPFGLDSAYIIATPAFADLDGDGDMDLLVGEAPHNENYLANLLYYENGSGPSGMNSFFNDENLVLYPNPVRAVLSVKSRRNIEKVEVFNMLGENCGVFPVVKNSISFSRLPSGLYLVKITFEKGDFALRKIKKE